MQGAAKKMKYQKILRHSMFFGNISGMVKYDFYNPKSSRV